VLLFAPQFPNLCIVFTLMIECLDV